MASRRVQAKTSDRDYGAPHQRERARVGRIVARGAASCVRCGRLIVPGSRWHLDHGDVKVPGRYLGPAHGSCNESAGAKSRARKRVRWSRVW